MLVRGGCVLMRLLGMLVGGGGVLLGLIMLAHAVMVGGRMVVVRRGRVVRGGMVMMLVGGMGLVGHDKFPPLDCTAGCVLESIIFFPH